MGLTKYAVAEVLSVEVGEGISRPQRRLIAKTLGLPVERVAVTAVFKTAHRAAFDYVKRPGYLYVRSRAISSRTNDNYDAFPAPEIKAGYRTFVGKPVFVNHHNANHRRARGVCIAAALHEDTNADGSPDTWVEVLMEVDALRFPKLARAILAKEIDRTSMGTDVEFSVCSACGNRAETPLDYCKHIPGLKGKKIRRTAAGGGHEDVLVYETCYGLKFFENSLLVEQPADPTAFFLGEVESGDPVEAAAQHLEAFARAEGERLRGDRPPPASPDIGDILGQHLRTALREGMGLPEPGSAHVAEPEREALLAEAVAFLHSTAGMYGITPDIPAGDYEPGEVPDTPSADHPCPRCKSDLGIHFSEGKQIYRGFHVPVTPETDTDDPARIVQHLFRHGVPVGTHWTTDHHRAHQTFGAPPAGHVGVVMAAKHPGCQHEDEVDPGYSHENEIALRSGAPVRLNQIQVWPDRAKYKRGQYDREWNDAHRHLPPEQRHRTAGRVTGEIDLADPEAGAREVEEACEKTEHTHSALAIKAADSGRVLLTQRTPSDKDDEGVYGRWEFPGGSIGDGETAYDSAVREFTEETGLELPEGHRIVGCSENGKYIAIIVLVPHEAWTTDASLLDFETMGIGWFDPDQVEGTDTIREEMAKTKWDVVKTAAEEHPHLTALKQQYPRVHVLPKKLAGFFMTPEGHFHHIGEEHDAAAAKITGVHGRFFPADQFMKDTGCVRVRSTERGFAAVAPEQGLTHPQAKGLAAEHESNGGEFTFVRKGVALTHIHQDASRGAVMKNLRSHIAGRTAALSPEHEHLIVKGHEVQVGDLLDSGGRSRVHAVRPLGDSIVGAYKTRGSKAPGVTSWHPDADVHVWRKPAKTAGAVTAAAPRPKVMPKGTYTLYRGERSHDRPSYYTKMSGEAGAWWTDDPKKAGQYSGGRHPDARVYAIDVEEHEFEPRGASGNYFIPDPAVRERRRLHQDQGRTAGLTVRDYEGEAGNRDHITRGEDGTIPTAAIAHLKGVQGEVPGGHRNRQGAAWESFLDDIRAHGIRDAIFITVDHDADPRISEGNHRRDAAVELGLPEVPVEIRYFGHAEQQGTVAERGRGRTAAADHEVHYHLTDNPKFSLDPKKVPVDNSLSLRNAGPERRGLYTTKTPEHWINGHGYVRPYVAEIHVPKEHSQHGEFGGEGFIDSKHFDKAKVHRVIPVDAHAREEYGEHGWIEEHHGTEFDTDKKIPSGYGHFRGGYKYKGPDVRDMPKHETDRHRDRWLTYMKENRGHDDESIEDLRKAHGSRCLAAGRPDAETQAFIDGVKPAAVRVGHNLGPWTPHLGDAQYGWESTCRNCGYAVSVGRTPAWIKRRSNTPTFDISWNPPIAGERCKPPIVTMFRGYHLDHPENIAAVAEGATRNPAQTATYLLAVLRERGGLGASWSTRDDVARGYAKQRVLNLMGGSQGFEFDPADYDGGALPVLVTATFSPRDQGKGYQHEHVAPLPEYAHEGEVWLRKHEQIRVTSVEVWLGGRWLVLAKGLSISTTATVRREEVLQACGARSDKEMDRLLEELAKNILGPVPGRTPEREEDPHAGYGGVIEQRRDGTFHSGGEPVHKVYRVVHPKEWEEAQRKGYLQSDGGSRGGGGYTRASAKPDERWRHQSIDPSATGRPPRGHTLEIDLHPDDKWHASAEGYVATSNKIPLHRVRKVGVLRAEAAASSGDWHDGDDEDAGDGSGLARRAVGRRGVDRLWGGGVQDPGAQGQRLQQQPGDQREADRGAGEGGDLVLPQHRSAQGSAVHLHIPLDAEQPHVVAFGGALSDPSDGQGGGRNGVPRTGARPGVLGGEVDCAGHRGMVCAAAEASHQYSRPFVNDRGHLEHQAGDLWHHGTPHQEPEEDDDDGMGEYDDRTHWNTHLGTHWTSQRHVAKDFAKGKYAQYGATGQPGAIHTAHLKIAKPKHYEAESHMDRRALDHAWSKVDYHDPYDHHDSVCPRRDEPGHFGGDHEPGDPVDTEVRKRYHADPTVWLNSHPERETIASHFKDHLKAAGHDGVTYGNEVEGPKGHHCAIAFEHEQIVHHGTHLVSMRMAALSMADDQWSKPKPKADWGNDDIPYDEKVKPEKEWKASVHRALGRGDLTHEQAEAAGHHHSGGDKWEGLPKTLYHVTTALPGVQQHGLKTRDELAQSRGKGLGGGASDTISFTEDEHVAHGIHRAVLERRSVAKGEYTPAQMIAHAKAGTGAKRPFHDDLTKSISEEAQHDIVHGKVSKSSVMGHPPRDPGDEQHTWVPHPDDKGWKGGDGKTYHSKWQRDATPDEHQENALHLHSTFSAYREHAGGHLDPLFFGADGAGLAHVPEHHIGVVRATPTPKGQGYRMGALGEWRTSTGAALAKVEHHPSPHDPKAPRTASRQHWTEEHQGHADGDNAYDAHGSHHTTGGRLLEGHPAHEAAVGDEDWHEKWHHPEAGAEPPDFVTAGAKAYRQKHGHAEPHDSPSVIQDKDRSKRMSDAYDALPDNDPKAHPAYRALAHEVGLQYAHMTRPVEHGGMGMKVEVVDHDPYPSHHHLVEDVTKNRRIKVMGTHVTGGHPILSNEENDQFRAVHDTFGHVATGRPFDRHGEESAWHEHASMFSPKARAALTTETRGQNASLIHNGVFPKQKVALLPDEFHNDEAVKGVTRRAMAHVGSLMMRALGWMEARLMGMRVAARESLEDLTEKTPQEIDTALAEHHRTHQEAGRRMGHALDTLHRAVGDEKTGRYNEGKWKRPHEEVMAHDHTTLPAWEQPHFKRALDEHATHKTEQGEAASHITRHNQEFQRRGGWSRFFMVPDGHIHSSQSCHSTRATTEHRWLPDVSGKSETEAVAAHGPTLCTHCFKSAPVEFKRNPSDVKREQGAAAKDEKAKAKAEREEALKVKRRGPAVQPHFNNDYDAEGHLEKAHEMGSRERRSYGQPGEQSAALHKRLHQEGNLPYEHRHENPVHPHPTDKNISTHMRSKHGLDPASIDHVNSIRRQIGHPPMSPMEMHHDSHHGTYADDVKHDHGEPKTGRRRTALDDQQAPAKVDTLRDSNCPVCGERDSWDGDECSVCAYIRPPKAFDDPDTDVASQVDLRNDDDNDDAIPGDATLTDPEEIDADASLFVPPEGTQDQAGEVDPDDEDEGLEDDEDGPVDPEDEDDEDDDDEQPWPPKTSALSMLPAPGSALVSL